MQTIFTPNILFFKQAELKEMDKKWLGKSYSQVGHDGPSSNYSSF